MTTRALPARAAIACAVGVWLALGLPAGNADARDLVIGLNQYPSTLHPSIDPMATKSYILATTRRPFTTHDADWTKVCLLCTTLPDLADGTAVRETRPDGSTGIAATFEIRPGARWGDGTPITTDDVLFTLRVGRHPRNGFANQQLYTKDIRTIRALDDRRFVVHWDRYFCDYQVIHDLQVLPAHLEGPVFDADPDDYRNASLYQTASTIPGLYFGPYRISRVEPGAFVVADRNPHWFGTRPAFDRLVFRVIENSAALEANLLSGDIDYIPGEVGLPLDQALALERRHGNRFRVVFTSGLFYEHIDVNLDHPVVSDLRVRRALIHAIDRATISERLFAGHQPVAHGTISPLDPVYEPEIRRYPYDPAAAAALLDQAGLARGADGLRRRPDGTPLVLTLATTGGNRSRELVAQVLQAHWRAVGLEVRIAPEPPRILFGQSLRERRFDSLAMYAWLTSPANVPRTTLHSTMIPSEANGYAGQNHPGLRDDRIDEALDRLEVTCEAAPRQALWSLVQRRYAELLPALPLFLRADAYVMPRWLAGVRPTGHQYSSALWIETWRVEE